MVEASAPGRVNLIGEHTDYNEGFVFPIATPQRTIVRLTRLDGRIARAVSENVDEGSPSEYVLGEERRTGTWIDYVQGVTAALREAGHTIGGFEARIASTVPLGAGLSSSASLEIAVVRALAEAFGLALSPIDAARIGHAAETGLVGAPVGIMDQMAASLAATDAALFLDTRTLAFERVPLPAAIELGVINSGQTHHHASGEYRVRRAECEEAARRLGVRMLRDVDVAALPVDLPPPLDRRVRHVVSENARVVAMRDALLAGDASRAGALMNDAHRSMSEDFEASTPEVDALASLARAEAGVFGARLTGGGFGGSIVFLARRGGAAAIAADVVRAFSARVALTPTVLIP